MENPNLDNPRLRALQQLQSAMPVANQRVATQQQAARDIQLQQAVGKAAPTAATPAVAQQAGAVQAQNAGQQMIQNAQTEVKQAGQVGQLGIQAQQTEGARQLGEQKMGAAEQKMSNVQRLANLDARAKKEMFDDQMQFQRDENNRALFNSRQLADYAKLNAERGEVYKNYAQSVEQATKRKQQYMQAAFDSLSQRLQQEYKKAELNQDYAAMQQIQQMQNSMNERMAREKAYASNKMAQAGALGTIVGAVGGGIIGGIYGGPGGAVVGASAGAAVGGGAGTAMGAKNQ